MALALGLLLALGGALWLRAMRHGMHPLVPGEGPRFGGTLFLVAMGLTLGANVLILKGLGGTLPATFQGQIQVQALSNVFALWVVVVLARRWEGALMPIGLRPHRGAPPFSLAFASFLAFYPVLAAITWLNQVVLRQVGIEPGVQDVLEAFIQDEDGQRSVVVWMLAAGLIPFCEEVFFRGLLFGALRRRMSPEAAIALSSLVFGLAHGETVLLPTAALGALFCWLYQRTGSLVVPTLAHGLHNGLTMAMVASAPAALG